MSRPRRLSLRARVALSTACIAAVAIAGISTIAWVTTRDRLHTQLDQALLELVPPANVSPPPDVPVPNAEWLCRAAPPDPGIQRFLEGIQLLRAGGGSCAPSGVDPVETSAQDRTVRATTLRDGRTRSGKSVRVLLQPVGEGNVLVASRNLAEIENTLAGLREVLVVVSLLGGALAAAASLLATRRAVAPMTRLTATAEEIARTEDLQLPDAVSGRDEVGRLGRAFASMIAALQESRRRQHELVTDAAHELRTPLTSLRTNIDLLARSEQTGRPIPAEQRAKIIDRLQAQAGEFTDLVTELVVLARDERELAREQVAVDTVIDRAARRARSRAPDHHFDIHCPPWTVVGDAAALERTVLNLLDNAIKFSPAGSTVRVRSEPGWITVVDEGPGLPDEHRTPAFQRFWRAPGARALPGSGLGLAMVADTVTAHGGAVRFEDPPGGGGACVRIELPHT
ncbi:two-component system histidine kinase [Amycolatopsis mediterranei S699]|uniref:histidine kinase n=2 Tax=Amycolatopsis mediterranei TaxID=33910 RepID=A0A0H3DBG0_AMYMU|nr:HAMP domain-containing sensor histidine kinase [Amycolatopsis mediterranei]ADJ47418.1 two-component system histidine kinase [Amycolatopsis mediterranei U32]AEK44264.1 two-component system histidine kinase [Amycolatopsis mediterranei S699]AFO79129.1 two-component system histidine kinase [Amycolatopsis mediterranei S699]AGT86257.1 two-component system histidine kinase [Amycolatopsis mediterranei RB]KDO12656.1 histidine kinase [Amycolatopsis mediterranei]